MVLSPIAECALVTSGQKITPCDCGVLWENVGTVQTISNIGNTGSYYGFGVRILTWNSTSNSQSLYLPVVDISQAMHDCYTRIDCHGVVFYTGVTFGQPFRAYFYDYTVVAGQTFATSPQLTGLNFGLAQVYNLTRSELYRCASFALTPYFYYFGDATRRAEIEQAFCVNRLPDTTCCWNTIHGVGIPPCTNLDPVSTSGNLTLDTAWISAANSHWAFYGHKLRYPPNSACSLTPTLWDTTSKCAQPTTGCFEFDGIPCGKRGFCTENTGALASPWYRDPDNSFIQSGPLYTTPNYCSCANYSVIHFGGVPIYHGRSCATKTVDACTQVGNNIQLCSGGNVNCLPNLIANTVPNNDYDASCQCDSNPPWPGTGTFCETGRCVPGGGPCGIDGSCVRVSQGPDVWTCQCGISTVGIYCQFSSSGCRVTSTSKCQGVGVCYPPGLPPDNATYPNINQVNAWCACPEESFFGSNCQYERCDPGQNVVPGHGRCSETGIFVACYAPYTSSNPPSIRCDVDRCNATGGVVVSTLINNLPSGALELVPTDCNCGKFRHGVSGDITCLPRCGNGTTGTLCGVGAPGEPNICVDSVVSSVRYAECVCGSGSIPVPVPQVNNDITALSPPPGKNKTICEPWCIHGSVLFTWVYPQPCNCLPNTLGFDIGPDQFGVSYPRCDHRTCDNDGVWDSGTQTCTCVGPYTSASKCRIQTCDNPTTTGFVEGVVIPDPLHPLTNEICLCSGPYTWSSQALTDCSANLCGTHGFPNPSITNTTLPASMCACTGGYITICNDFSGTTCAFCASTGCENGGVLVIAGNTNVCACNFPWEGDLFCSTSVCGINSQSFAGLCSCTELAPGVRFSGRTCKESPCIHGNWSQSLLSCACAPEWTGPVCDVSVFQPPNPSSSSSSSSTGVSSSTAISVSSSSSSSTAASNVTVAASSSTEALSTGAIAGIAVGGAAAATLVIVGGLWLGGVIGTTTTATATTTAAATAAASAAPHAMAVSVNTPLISGLGRQNRRKWKQYY